MKTYKYGMRLRPFGIGCQPEGQIAWEDTDKAKTGYWSTVTYDRKLTAEEEYSYELDFLKEEER